MINIKVLSGAILLGLGSSLTLAETKDPNVDPKARAQATATAQAVRSLALAGELANYGLANNDSLALITAARILKTTPTREEELDKTSSGEGGEGAETADKQEGPSTFETSFLLAQAREFAGDDAGLKALADDVEAMSQKGRRGGPIRHRDRVRAGRTDVYSITFRGGEIAQVYIEGDEDTDLDFFVYDEHGNEIFSDEDYTDFTFAEWTPKWTGPFRVEIRNLGDVWNAYDLITN